MDGLALFFCLFIHERRELGWKLFQYQHHVHVHHLRSILSRQIESKVSCHHHDRIKLRSFSQYSPLLTTTRSPPLRPFSFTFGFSPFSRKILILKIILTSSLFPLNTRKGSRKIITCLALTVPPTHTHSEKEGERKESLNA